MIPGEPLDILYVGTFPPHPGGSAVCGSLLLGSLADRGHAVRVIAPMAPLSGRVDGETHPALRVTSFPLPYFDSSPDIPASSHYRRLHRERACRLVAKAFTEERPDVVVVGREIATPGVTALVAAEAVPCIVWVHGMPTQAILRGSYPKRLAREVLAGLRVADRLVTASLHLAAGLGALGLQGVEAIPNPVDLGLFAPRPADPRLRAELGIPEGDVVVAHISNMKPVKRPLDLVFAAELARAAGARITYVVVGDGLCRPEMEAECERRGLAAKFRFVGWVPHAAVPDFVNLADIVVMPSEYENQALAYLETQACARLLVASDVAGAREVVTPGRTGLLFRMGDVHDLAAKVLLAAGDPALRLKVGAAARARVRVHSLAQVATAHEAVLAETAKSATLAR